MKLEQTYAYLKERYSITHSFSTFKHNAIKKGLDKDKDYLKLIASVLFSMGYYREGVEEVATDIHETYCGELDGLEAHIKALESEKAKAVQFGEYVDKKALGLTQTNRQLYDNIKYKNKLIRELRAKKDITRNKELERKAKQLEKASEEYFNDCVKLTGEKKKLEKELSLAKTYTDVLNNSYDDMKRQRDSAEASNEANYNKYREEKANAYDWKKVAIARRKVIDTKRTELGKSMREIEKLEEKNLFYKSSVSQWRKENKKLQDELNTLKHQTLFQTLQTYFKNKKS